MPDNNQITHPIEVKRIAINDRAAVRSWCTSFGCTEHELRKAVKVVGTSGNNVKKYLAK